MKTDSKEILVAKEYYVRKERGKCFPFTLIGKGKTYTKYFLTPTVLQNTFACPFCLGTNPITIAN